MPILKVDKDTVVDKWGLPGNYGLRPGIKIVRDEIVDTSRWSVHHELICEIDGVLYRVFYSRGATECQDESPWEYEKVVEFIPVREVSKVVVDYEDIPQEPVEAVEV